MEITYKINSFYLKEIVLCSQFCTVFYYYCYGIYFIYINKNIDKEIIFKFLGNFILFYEIDKYNIYAINLFQINKIFKILNTISSLKFNYYLIPNLGYMYFYNKLFNIGNSLLFNLNKLEFNDLNDLYNGWNVKLNLIY